MCNHDHFKKISKFGDFILENKAAKLLLEGNLMASEKFLKKLNSIRGNPIADILHQSFYNKEFIDKDLAQNWVDVSDKDDAVTFMSDRGAKRVDPMLGTGLFTTKGRNEIKVGRLARAILTELGKKVVDKDIEVFVNTYKAALEDVSKKFILVNGPIIKKYYLEDSYASQKGTLGDSCMKDESSQSYFKIYTKNPENCQLLVYLDENDKVLGRALVWKLHTKEMYTMDQKPTECPAEYFMDRVYTANDSDVIKFTNHAKEKGWLYKWKMVADDKDGIVFKYNDKLIFGCISVELNKCLFRKYPFVDSLNFCDGDSLISNVGFPKNEGDEDDEPFVMQNTDGSSEQCSGCDGSGYDDNDGGTDCRKCDGDGTVPCGECRGRGREICKKCDGRGDIICKKCDGDGEYNCRVCDGDGDIKCKTCGGDGHKDCVVCNGRGDMGDCKKCDGICDIMCPTCKGEDTICKICSGEGKITKAWGRGHRTVVCPGCGGEGKGRNGDSKKTGCKCTDCGITHQWKMPSTWENTGRIVCPDCGGKGNITCKACEDKEGSGSPGEIECEDCGGDGLSNCTNRNCDNGTIRCEECDGDRSVGDCKECDGNGTIGKCKNPKCQLGNVKCSVCDGSGERPKNAKKALCPDCAGLLDVFKEELASGDFKVK